MSAVCCDRLQKRGKRLTRVRRGARAIKFKALLTPAASTIVFKMLSVEMTMMARVM